MSIPRIPGDSSVAFLADGYLFGHRRFERLGTDVFRTRLLGRPVTLFRGTSAVRSFYEGDRFTRVGAVPRSVVHSLQDVGSVQTLTGYPHHVRKSLFTKLLLDGERSTALVDAFSGRWDAAWAEAAGHTIDVRTWSGRVLADAVLTWLGVDEPVESRRALAGQCLAMIDGAGSFGPRNWIGRLRRLSTERWASDTVELARYRDPSTPIGLLASELRDAGTAVAARELLNLLRPTVAVSHFIVFAALALHLRPQWRERIASEPHAATAFAQEVRRTTPFFPAIGGIATTPVTIGEAQVAPGDWVLVDLFATDRHPREWSHAWSFDPARFAGPSPLSGGGEHAGEHPVVAQGAGDYGTTHHCPGEPRTVDLLAHAVRRMASAEWSLAPGDHRVDLGRLPARPRTAAIRISR